MKEKILAAADSPWNVPADHTIEAVEEVRLGHASRGQTNHDLHPPTLFTVAHITRFTVERNHLLHNISYAHITHTLWQERSIIIKSYYDDTMTIDNSIE